MKTILRILAAVFYTYLYFGLQFDLFSCLVGFTIVYAITTNLKIKKPEADTSSF